MTRRRPTIAASYYTLVVRENGRWAPEYGAYSLRDVRDEIESYVDNGTRKSDIKIVTTETSRQADIDAEIAKLNGASASTVRCAADPQAALAWQWMKPRLAKLDWGEWPQTQADEYALFNQAVQQFKLDATAEGDLDTLTIRNRLAELKRRGIGKGQVGKKFKASTVRASYGVYMKGGSIGSKGESLISEEETEEAAKAKAKRMNARRSPGEKQYYGIRFFVKPIKASIRRSVSASFSTTVVVDGVDLFRVRNRIRTLADRGVDIAETSIKRRDPGSYLMTLGGDAGEIRELIRRFDLTYIGVGMSIRRSVRAATGETLVSPAWVYDGNRRVPGIQYRVGETAVIENAAPGAGRVVYKITRHDADGFWGVKVSDTRRASTRRSVSAGPGFTWKKGDPEPITQVYRFPTRAQANQFSDMLIAYLDSLIGRPIVSDKQVTVKYDQRNDAEDIVARLNKQQRGALTKHLRDYLNPYATSTHRSVSAATGSRVYRIEKHRGDSYRPYAMFTIFYVDVDGKGKGKQLRESQVDAFLKEQGGDPGAEFGQPGHWKKLKGGMTLKYDSKKPVGASTRR